MLQLVQTIRYLLYLPIVRAEANAGNQMALTTLDILEQSPRDFRSLEIQQILADAGITRENNQYGNLTASSPNRAAVREEGAEARWWRKLIDCCLKYESDWLVETRGMLMVVATMISTMTFQVGINPPGGVLQDNNISNSTSPGTAVLGYGSSRSDYLNLLNYNTISFFASTTVTLILISGIPLHNNQVCVWILSMAMFVAVTCLSFTYRSSIDIVTPIVHESKYHWTLSFWGRYGPFYFVRTSLLCMILGLHSIRFLIWLVKRLPQRFRHKIWQIMRCKNIDGRV